MDVSALLDAIKGFGSAAPVIGIFAYLWHRADTERKELNTKLMELMPRAIEAENAMTHALETLAGKIKL